MAARSWRIGRTFVLGLVGALFLASCGVATTTSSLRVTGIPAPSISIALQKVGCTSDNTCIALGASSLGLTAVVSTTPNRWTTLSVPSTTAQSISAVSCWRDGCLVAGSAANGALLWSFNASSDTLTPLTLPGGSRSVDALSCYAELSCDVVDTSFNGVLRWYATTDGATSWSQPTSAAVSSSTSSTTSTTLAVAKTVALPLSALAAVQQLTCTSEDVCLVAQQESSHVMLFASASGSWVKQRVPSSWTSLTSLRCFETVCIGEVATKAGGELVRSKNFGRTFSASSLANAPTGVLACRSATHCVSAGVTPTNGPFIAVATNATVSVASTRYVPTPFIDAACGANRCVAIGVTTLSDVRP